jgi:uncharacterized protein YjeT (DUF2065 family)
MLDALGPALALMLVLEGLLPLFSPASWRSAMLRVATLADGQIRFVGLGSIILGLFTYWALG